MRAVGSLLCLATAAAMPLRSTPDLGKREGECRPNETGPAFLVTPVGLLDRAGTLKLEVYPPNNHDLLEDDNVLISAGKVFRRVEEHVPQAGPITLCIRVPSPGAYSLVLLHDRDENRKYGWRVDGVGFSGNPHIGWGKPRADKTRVVAGSGLTRLSIVLNYHHGLGVAPLKEGDS
jgi:uncharacterized protein (DUF2141 family)